MENTNVRGPVDTDIETLNRQLAAATWTTGLPLLPSCDPREITCEKQAKKPSRVRGIVAALACLGVR